MFRHHPDGIIYIGLLEYPLAQFLIDAPTYSLPSGMIGREYIPGVKHILSDGSSQYAGPMPWPEGDAYLANENNYTHAYWQRLNPPPTLPQAQAAKFSVLDTAYNAAIQTAVAYMGTTFQADLTSQNTLNKVLTALTPVGSTPPGFYWVDASNNQIPMTLAQLQGLAAAMMAQGWAAFQHLQGKKSQVLVAQTVPEVEAVTW